MEALPGCDPREVFPGVAHLRPLPHRGQDEQGIDEVPANHARWPQPRSPRNARFVGTIQPRMTNGTSCDAEMLPQWAHQGFIQLRAWDGHTSRHWNEWPDLDSFFFNQTDGGNVRVTLLAAGREHLELLKKNGISLTSDV